MCIFTSVVSGYYTGFFFITAVLLVENVRLPGAGNVQTILLIYKKSKRRKTLKAVFSCHKGNIVNRIIDSLDK